MARQIQPPLGAVEVAQAGNTRSSRRSGGILTGMLAVSLLLSPSLQAGLIFTAGGAAVQPGDLFNLTITASGFTSVASAQFTLSWDPGVLSLQVTPVGGLPGLLALTSGNFGPFPDNPTPGRLTFSWFEEAGVTLPDHTTIFEVQFSAIGSAGSSTSVRFTDDLVPRAAAFTDLIEFVPGTVDGMVSVVPEPVNAALAAFGCIVLVGSAVRWRWARRAC